MAYKEKKKNTLDYGALQAKLSSQGPARLYLLCGEEDFLRQHFLGQLRTMCLGEGGSEFNHHRLSGAKLELSALSEAVDSMPFFSDRTLIEVGDFDVGAYRDAAADALLDILSDIPEFATVVLLTPVGVEPDGRLSLVKKIKQIGEYIDFTSQSHDQLTGWIVRHFAAAGKRIGAAECERLVFFSGELMTGLLPEINKLASYVSGDTVTVQDIEKVAHRIPAAQAFELTDLIGEGDFDGAAAVLSELMSIPEEHPIKVLALIGMQMRKIYAARLVLDSGGDKAALMSLVGTGSSYYGTKLANAAERFTAERLRQIMTLCCQADYAMKSSGADDKDILTDLLLRIAVA